ncbi:MAG: hypothetical protein JNJ61_05665 [Anaerolineae bacterium]|nr:hypothetical protein [Anaerolineae bacterium]
MSYSNSLLDAVVEIALLLISRLFFTSPADDRTDQAAANKTPAPHIDETSEQFLSGAVEAANSMHDRQ